MRYSAIFIDDLSELNFIFAPFSKSAYLLNLASVRKYKMSRETMLSGIIVPFIQAVCLSENQQ